MAEDGDRREHEPEQVDDETSSDTRTCPYCAEDIKAAAIVCKHCGRELDDEPSTPPAKAPAKASEAPNPDGKGCLQVIGVLVAISLFFAACTAIFGDDNGSTSSSGGTRSGDASARAACRHFANIVGDVRAGILTDAELRDKLSEVHSSARASSNSRLASSAQAMLSAVTTGTPTDLAAAIASFDSACSSVR